MSATGVTRSLAPLWLCGLHAVAVAYLHQRGIRSQALIEHMRIGYAPGGCLRGWLSQLGHSLRALRQAGLVTGVRRPLAPRGFLLRFSFVINARGPP
jgi:hypothetical protein